MVQYLHFRILKFPLILCPYDLSSLRPDWPLINALMAANSLARRNILHWGWFLFCGVHLGWWRKEVLLPGTTQYIQDYPHNENIHWPIIINYNIFSFSQFWPHMEDRKTQSSSFFSSKDARAWLNSFASWRDSSSRCCSSAFRLAKPAKRRRQVPHQPTGGVRPAWNN
jgi:hypothetical protein